jgi:hypothetical protein
LLSPAELSIYEMNTNVFLIKLRDWKKHLDKLASKAGDCADKAVCSAWGAAITMDASITALKNNTETLRIIYPDGRSGQYYGAEKGQVAGMLMSQIGTVPGLAVLVAAEAALYIASYKALNIASRDGGKKYTILQKPIVKKLPVYGLMLLAAYRHYEGFLSWL